MRRPRPLAMKAFDEARPALGDRSFVLILGALRMRLEGLDRDLADRLAERFGAFVGKPSAAAEGLVVACAREPRDYFIPPPERPELNPIGLVCDGDRVRYIGYRVAGWFDIRDGAGQLRLAGGDYEPAERSVENYVRAAVAWQASSRGGALVHAASAVRDGKGYLFYGQSGAGKSTLAAANRRGTVVSDDLSLVLPGDDGHLRLVGSPFRGTYEEGHPVIGEFPLRAGFRLIQAAEARVEPVPRGRAMAELIGNLPFVAEAFAARPDRFAAVDRGFADVPLAHLHFRPDDAFWDAIEAAGLG